MATEARSHLATTSNAQTTTGQRGAAIPSRELGTRVHSPMCKNNGSDSTNSSRRFLRRPGLAHLSRSLAQHTRRAASSKRAILFQTVAHRFKPVHTHTHVQTMRTRVKPFLSASTRSNSCQTRSTRLKPFQGVSNRLKRCRTVSHCATPCQASSPPPNQKNIVPN